MVDHDTLHDAYARAGFVLYPTAFPGQWFHAQSPYAWCALHRVDYADGFRRRRRLQSVCVPLENKIVAYTATDTFDPGIPCLP